MTTLMHELQMKVSDLKTRNETLMHELQMKVSDLETRNATQASSIRQYQALLDERTLASLFEPPEKRLEDRIKAFEARVDAVLVDLADDLTAVEDTLREITTSDEKAGRQNEKIAEEYRLLAMLTHDRTLVARRERIANTFERIANMVEEDLGSTPSWEPGALQAR